MAVHAGGRGPGHTSRKTLIGVFVPGGTPASITAPVLSAHTTDPNIAGDLEPAYNINYVDAYPTGGGIGDTLEGRWGISEAGAEAFTPEAVTITEAMFIDGTDPFPNLGLYGKARTVGETVHYQVRVKRGTSYSPWSNFRTLLIEDGVPNAPGVADLTGQTTSSRVWSTQFTVAGLATGAYARLMATGPMRVSGTTVTEAGTELLVQNGALLEFGVDTSASAGVQVDNVVSNRGVVLETFSATTAGASVQVVASTKQFERFATAATSHTATAVDFVAGTAVVVVGYFDHASATITSVTIGGVTATRHAPAGMSNAGYAIYTAPITAGSHNVVVSYSTSVTNTSYYFFTLKNAALPLTVSGAGYGAVGGTTITTGALTIPANGLGIAVVRRSGTTNMYSLNGTLVASGNDGFQTYEFITQGTSGQPISYGVDGNYNRTIQWITPGP